MSTNKHAHAVRMALAIPALWLSVEAGNAVAGVNNADIQLAPGGTVSFLSSGASSVLANASVTGDAQLLNVVSWTPVAHGTLDLNPDGTFQYVNDGLGDTTDGFTYQACQTGTCSSATVSIEMIPNSGSVAGFYASNDGIEMASGATTTRLISGTTSVVNDAGWLIKGGQPCTASTCTFSVIGNPAHGSVAMNANGTFTYVNDGQGASTDYFRYQACPATGSCASATVSIVVVSGNILNDDVPLALSAGFSSTCSVMFQQDARCWGSNDGGMLGSSLYGTLPSQAAPVLDRASNPLLGIQTIALGNYHACALMTAGTVLCWGSNTEGQLGNGQVDQLNHPAGYVKGLGPNDTARAVSIASGQAHTCVVLTNGTVECWGNNAHDEVGQVNPAAPNLENIPVPTPVNLGGAVATSVTAGYYHACATTSQGTLCWGLNTLGQLGRPTAPSNWATPGTSILQLAGMTQLASGPSADHVCALSASGALWCWGRYESGELGDQTSQYGFVPMGRYNPSKVFGGLDVSSYALGGLNTCGIVIGAVWCWGDNSSGQLADPSAGLQYSAIPVASSINAGATAVAVGIGYACALVNKVDECWGINEDSALGIGVNSNEIPATSTPRPVLGIPPVPAAPKVAEAFSPTLVGLTTNTSTTMTITLNNPDPGAIYGVAFDDIYPAGIANASSGALQSNSCGGTVTSPAGGSSTQLLNGTIPAGGSCSIVIRMVATQSGTWANPTGPVTSTNALDSAGASASVTYYQKPVKPPVCNPGSCS